MRHTAAALCLLCAVAWPASAQDLLEQVPTDSAVVRGDYAKLANCIYARLDAELGTGIKKVDLQNEVRLALESSGVRYWHLTLTPAQPGYTKADLTRVQTIFGPMRFPQIMQAVQACATEK
jgi:hypothetical protein